MAVTNPNVNAPNPRSKDKATCLKKTTNKANIFVYAYKRTRLSIMAILVHKQCAVADVNFGKPKWSCRYDWTFTVFFNKGSFKTVFPFVWPLPSIGIRCLQKVAGRKRTTVMSKTGIGPMSGVFFRSLVDNRCPHFKYVRIEETSASGKWRRLDEAISYALRA